MVSSASLNETLIVDQNCGSCRITPYAERLQHFPVCASLRLKSSVAISGTRK